MGKYLFLAASLGLLASCTTVTNSGTGIIFTEVVEPVSADNGVKSLKHGEACQTAVMGLVSTGDSSIEAAKKNGGITKVSTVNVKKNHILIYGTACTVVTGE